MAKVDKQHPTLETSVQSVKKSTPPWPWQQHIFLARENIFTVILALWQEDCGAVVESTFQHNSVSPTWDTEKYITGNNEDFFNVRPSRASRRSAEMFKDIWELNIVTPLVWRRYFWGILEWKLLKVYGTNSQERTVPDKSVSHKLQFPFI